MWIVHDIGQDYSITGFGPPAKCALVSPSRYFGCSRNLLTVPTKPEMGFVQADYRAL